MAPVITTAMMPIDKAIGPDKEVCKLWSGVSKAAIVLVLAWARWAMLSASVPTVTSFNFRSILQVIHILPFLLFMVQFKSNTVRSTLEDQHGCVSKQRSDDCVRAEQYTQDQHHIGHPLSEVRDLSAKNEHRACN